MKTVNNKVNDENKMNHQLNEKVFVMGGRIGRVKYVLNSVEINLMTTVAILVMAVVAGGLTAGLPEKFCEFVILFFMIPVFIGWFSFRYGTIRKRLRDIYPQDGEPHWGWGFVMLTPFFSLILELFLWFTPGLSSKKFANSNYAYA